MVVVQEVVLADGPHVRVDPLANFTLELLERPPFPLGSGLHDGRVYGFFDSEAAIELDRRPRAVPIEHVVHAGRHFDDQRHLDHHQVQLPGETLLDVFLHIVNGLLGALSAKQRLVIPGQDLVDFLIGTDAWSGQVRSLI